MRHFKTVNDKPQAYTPKAWHSEDVTLKCSSCGERIRLDGHYQLDYVGSEQTAFENFILQKHTCAPNAERLKEAKRIMGLYREEHPNITFEESMEIYKIILEQCSGVIYEDKA